VQGDSAQPGPTDPTAVPLSNLAAVADLPAHEARRVALTTAVRDTDHIPKVDDAGDVRILESGRVQVMHNGLLVEYGCYHGEMMAEIIRVLRGHHEPQEEAVFHQLLTRLGEETTDGAYTMVELGSFWAYYSMWFNRAFPGARNIMVEPDPVNIDVGRRNFALNGMTGSFVHGAVGFDHGGTVWLPCESDWRVRKIPTVTIPGLMSEHQIEHLDLILCDTQGAEIGVLESCLASMSAGRIRFVVVSTHHHTITGDPLTHQRCLELLSHAGARIIAEHSIAESCSGDGLIAASMDPRDAGFTIEVTHVRAKNSIFGELEYDLAKAQRWSGPLRRFGAQALSRARDLFRRQRAPR
jgi:FkbM family methyltransferase